MLLHELIHLTYDFDQLVNYLADKKVIWKEIECPRCNTILYFRDGNSNFIFKCVNKYYKVVRGRKRMKKLCNFAISGFHGTWFSRSHLQVEKICRFIGYFLMFPPPRQTFLEKELNMSSTSVVDWTNFCREVSTIWYTYIYIYIYLHIHIYIIWIVTQEGVLDNICQAH